MTFDGRRVRIPVEDEADVVARYVASRCLELAVSKVADAVLRRRGPRRRVG